MRRRPEAGWQVTNPLDGCVNFLQITPGAGGMYCGNCFRDNALVAALRRTGHQSTLVPLYLPMTLDEPDQSRGTPIFFGGISVYLQQQSSLFRSMPGWLRNCLSHPALLKWASGRAARTRAADVGDLTVSMLRGEDGYQASELDALAGWLEGQPRPDIISLSNAMLLGMADTLRSRLKAPVVCMLQGEDAFLDDLPEPHRSEAWRLLAERARRVELCIAPSHYYGERMRERLGLAPGQVAVLWNGIRPEGFKPAPLHQDPPVLGFFARMCREKGLDTFVEAFLLLKRRAKLSRLRCKIGGGCGPSDEAFVAGLKNRLEAAGVLGSVEFHPNLTREQKQEFFSTLTALSVPALYGEAFGLYLVEAWACGVPVVQPRHASFPELIGASGGGLLCEPGNAASLAERLAEVLEHPGRAAELGRAGRAAFEKHFTDDAMAAGLTGLVAALPSRYRSVPA